jgi:hypothetical protein
MKPTLCLDMFLSFMFLSTKELTEKYGTET